MHFSLWLKEPKLLYQNRGLLVSFAAVLGLTACTGGAGEASPSTLNEPLSTTTTVVDRPLGVALLTQAIPSPVDLPNGWTAQGSGDSSLTEILNPKTGKGLGLCGGPNRDELLKRYGVVAWAWSPALTPPSEGDYGYIGIFEFRTSSEAARFMDAISMVGACGSETYTARELGEGETQETTPEEARVAFFSGSDNTTKWSISANYSIGGSLVSSKAPGHTSLTTLEYSSRFSGNNFGVLEQTVYAYEQYQNVVVRFELHGRCCLYGFANTEGYLDDTRPSLLLLDGLATKVRNKLLVSLSLDKVHE